MHWVKNGQNTLSKMLFTISNGLLSIIVVWYWLINIGLCHSWCIMVAEIFLREQKQKDILYSPHMHAPHSGILKLCLHILYTRGSPVQRRRLCVAWSKSSLAQRALMVSWVQPLWRLESHRNKQKECVNMNFRETQIKLAMQVIKSSQSDTKINLAEVKKNQRQRDKKVTLIKHCERPLFRRAMGLFCGEGTLWLCRTYTAVFITERAWVTKGGQGSHVEHVTAVCGFIPLHGTLLEIQGPGKHLVIYYSKREGQASGECKHREFVSFSVLQQLQIFKIVKNVFIIIKWHITT